MNTTFLFFRKNLPNYAFFISLLSISLFSVQLSADFQCDNDAPTSAEWVRQNDICCCKKTQADYGNRYCYGNKVFEKLITTPMENVGTVVDPSHFLINLDPPLAELPDNSNEPLPSADIPVGSRIDRTGQVVLVVGGSKGMGKATAERFAAAGARVIATSRFPKNYPKPANYTLSEVPLEIGSEESVRHFFEEVIKPLGKVDVLYIPAARSLVGRTSDITGDAAEKALNILAAGPIRVVYYALPYMRHSNDTRVIVNGSITGSFVGLGFQAVYDMAKRGLQSWNQAINLEEMFFKACGQIQFGPFFSLVQPNAVQTGIDVYEGMLPPGQDIGDNLNKAEAIFLAYTQLNPSPSTKTAAEVGDLIYGIGISKQPSAFYTIPNNQLAVDFLEFVASSNANTVITGLGFNFMIPFFTTNEAQRQCLEEFLLPFLPKCKKKHHHSHSSHSKRHHKKHHHKSSSSSSSSSSFSGSCHDCC